MLVESNPHVGGGPQSGGGAPMLEEVPPCWRICPHLGSRCPHVGGGAEGGEIVAGANFRAIDERSGHAAAINHRNRSSTSSAEKHQGGINIIIEVDEYQPG